MSSRYTYPIDWRDQLSALEHFIGGQGGVVNVKYANDQCAPNAFVETLTSLYENRPVEAESSGISIRSRSLRIDRENYKVRYLPEIRNEFVRKMGLTLSPPTSVLSRPSTASNVLTGNSAQGNQTITATLIYPGDNDVSLGERRDDWIQNLCEQLQDFLQRNRFMLIIMSGNHSDQREFWASLWHGGLCNLTAQGLFLVRMLEDDMISPHDDHLAPQCDAEIRLPLGVYGDQEEHAVEDIAAWIRRSIPTVTAGEAKIAAMGYVADHKDDRSALHNAGFWIQTLAQKLNPI